MEVQYRLGETIVVVDGAIDVVSDKWLHTADEDDWGSAVAQVSLIVQGDEGTGAQTVSLAERGDTDFAIELTADMRLNAVTYKSVGVGGRVIAAAATLVATVTGLAVRMATPGPRGALNLRTATVDEMEAQRTQAVSSEQSARDKWNHENRELAAHHSAYVAVLRKTREKLLSARQKLVDAEETDQMTVATAKIYRLGAAEGAAQAEIDKVEALYLLWRNAFKTRRTVSKSFSLSMASLPQHDVDAAPEPSTLSDRAKSVWNELGVIVEVGPADGYGPTGGHQRKSDQDSTSGRRVLWRVHRPVRLWIWQRGSDGSPALVRTVQADVVDQHSAVEHMELSGGAFGERGGGLNRPGFVVGSFYLIPTPVGAVCWSA